EGEMKIGKWIVAAALIGFALPARAATTDPMKVLYVWSGARDSGESVEAGVASTIHCSSFSGTSELLQIAVKNGSGVSVTVTGPSFSIPSGGTLTFSTHPTNSYTETFLFTGALSQGSMAVLATSISIFCTAQVLNAADTVPVG